jgi:hypothetical protein
MSRLDINSYKDLGFKRVCDVKEYQGDWLYDNFPKDRSDPDYNDYMYSKHDSWVYAITSDGTIKKIGESGNPLGIRGLGNQPKTGSKSRLGRYSTGDGTDKFVRDSLKDDIQSGKQVSIWAKKCDIAETQITIEGNHSVTINSSIHKELEKELLDYIKNGNSGNYPDLNKGRA